VFEVFVVAEFALLLIVVEVVALSVGFLHVFAVAEDITILEGASVID
jgi:hypothetical protein